jgi:16S rRNA G1207 methylase RsmC
MKMRAIKSLMLFTKMIADEARRNELRKYLGKVTDVGNCMQSLTVYSSPVKTRAHFMYLDNIISLNTTDKQTLNTLPGVFSFQGRSNVRS